MTKKMIVNALQSVPAASGGTVTPGIKNYSYDAHADWELSRLLSALDEQAKDPEIKKDAAKLHEIRQMAETCVGVLETQTESAEVFIQLAERALNRKDFNKLDALANVLTERFSPIEVCEIARQTTNGAVRALAQEALSLMPVPALIPCLEDPLYSEIARVALEQQAFDYDSVEAQELLQDFEQNPLE